MKKVIKIIKKIFSNNNSTRSSRLPKKWIIKMLIIVLIKFSKRFQIPFRKAIQKSKRIQKFSSKNSYWLNKPLQKCNNNNNNKVKRNW